MLCMELAAVENRGVFSLILLSKTGFAMVFHTQIRYLLSHSIDTILLILLLLKDLVME